MKHFVLQELVCQDVYNKYGTMAWQFLDNKLLETLEFIREHLGKPIIINNWHRGGHFSQRGLRCNLCPLVRDKDTPYLSTHIFGQGVDFDVKGMTAKEVRRWIIKHQHQLPYNIRLETDISWIHLDVRGGKDKITYFKP